MKYHVNKWWDKANLEDIDKGMDWYTIAHKFAIDIAEKHNLDIKVVCGIISALSPAVSWERNIIDAIELILKGNKAVVSTYSQNKDKALRILNGGDIEQEFNKKTGSFKTWNFYNNILNPNDENFVTVDRHMISLLGIKFPSITRKRYYYIADEFKKHAKRLNMIPNQLQAILWECYRRDQETLFHANEPDLGF